MAKVLLIVGGGIAAYKSLELVRLLKRAGHSVTPVLTKGGEHFVTAMSLGTLAEAPVYSSLWELKDEVEIGHIQLSRAADFVLVCPATADLLANMAAGLADDLATTLLLATDKPVVVAPAMNVRMWLHPSTARNVQRLVEDGIKIIEPGEGEMACGEYGPGRLPEPEAIMEWLATNALFGAK
jgi:phosphopantothenoylcysteine decarboxylase/phosphopantothenate--cysteine ligase